MKALIRIVPLQGHTDWMIKLGKIAPTKEIIRLLINPSQGKVFAEGLEEEAKKDLLHLLSLPTKYSDYHGVGQLETPYFLVLHDTFPPLVEARVLEFNKEKEG